MGMFSSGMGLIGALAGFAGEKPNVPEFEGVDTSKAAQDAANANLASFSSWADLAEKANKLSMDELFKNMERISPGSTKLFGQGTKMIQDQMAGNLPSDVMDNIQRNAATRAMEGGYAGSEMSHNLTSRDLGLQSLQLSQQGLTNAMNWLGRITSLAPQFNFMNMFVTPAQALQAQMFNTENTWNRNWLNEQIKAAPSPTDVAWINAFQGFGGMMDQVAGAALGMATGMPMGGMGGGGGGGGGGQDTTWTPQNYNYGTRMGGYDMNGMQNQYGGMA